MSERFDGKGFDKDPIEGDEAARHRHMFKDVSENWVQLDDATTFIRAAKMLPGLMKVIVACGVFGAIVAVLVKLGGAS